MGTLAKANNLHKKLEDGRKELKDKETIIENILKNSLSGYWDWYIQKEVIYLSPSYKSMFGYEEHEISNSPDSWQKIIHPDDLAKSIEAYKKHVDTKGSHPYEIEVQYLHKNGSIIWVRCIGSIIKWDKNDKPIRMIGCNVNITELKEAELEIKRLNRGLENKIKERTKELEKSKRELEEFSYVASHDLKSPLINISSLIIMLDNNDYISSEGKFIFNKLKFSINLLQTKLNALNDILDMKSSWKNKKVIISFDKTLKKVLNELSELITENDTEIIADFSECPQIKYPPIQLYSILYNLISNSLKYKNHNEKAIIEITTSKSDNKTLLVIKDNGMGFDQKLGEKKIFGLFKRLHTHVDGLGIGLFIVKSIVNSLGGNIKVISKLNKGTTFKIHL